MGDNFTPANPRHYYEYGNLPMRITGTNGRVPLVPRDVAPHEDLMTKYYPRARTFRMWDKEDMDDYDEVMDKIGRGHAQLRDEDKQFVKDKQTWILFVSWVDIYLEKPENAPITTDDNTGVPSSGVRVHR